MEVAVGSGATNQIAIDDVSFSDGCKLVSSSSAIKHSKSALTQGTTVLVNNKQMNNGIYNGRDSCPLVISGCAVIF